MRRNVPQAPSDATRAAESTPILASSRWRPWKARLATSSDTVNPTPATTAPPRPTTQLSSRRSPSRRLVASATAPVIPSGLPTT